MTSEAKPFVAGIKGTYIKKKKKKFYFAHILLMDV